MNILGAFAPQFFLTIARKFMNKHEHDFLNMKEAQIYLSLKSHKTLYNWVSQGRITVYKMGRYNMFKKSDLDKMFVLKR
jgi:excisionase family DNA binding protein